jgi:hypothetical protein
METMGTGIDVIGDIHGHEAELRALLDRLGYKEARGAYRHPEGRRVLFLGDFIDRGPCILQTLQIVRAMVEEGTAMAILGNHELNALRYFTNDSAGKPLREHCAKNTGQVQATIDQIPPDQLKYWLSWFANLPLWLDLGDLRAVHACWDEAAMRALKDLGPLTPEVLATVSVKGTPGHTVISHLLNGPEGWLPEGVLHETADGTLRPEFRVRWWANLEGLSCADAIFPECSQVPDLPPAKMPECVPYPEDACPVFFGHYAIRDGREPAPQAANLACLDYGVGKGGFLCAYRWDGEHSIESGKFLAGSRTY